MANQQEQNESRGARLMRKMAGQKEDGTGGGESSGAGASLGGNAGLSQMGAIPNAGFAVVKGQNKAGIQCPTCHQWTNNDNGMCEQCGASLTPMRESTGRSASDFSERFNGYRQRQAGVVTEQRVQLQPNSRGTVFEEIASQVTSLIRDMSPDLLPYEDTAGEESLHERVQSMLEGFVGWKARRKRN